MNPFVASSPTTITTTTRQPTTTRPRGSILFFERTTTRAPSSGRSETGCRAVGRWRGRPGMDAWCSSNCRRFHCPRGVCTCESPRWQNKLPFIFCVGRVGNRINEWFEAGQELEGGGDSGYCYVAGYYFWHHLPSDSSSSSPNFYHWEDHYMRNGVLMPTSTKLFSHAHHKSSWTDYNYWYHFSCSDGTPELGGARVEAGLRLGK